MTILLSIQTTADSHQNLAATPGVGLHPPDEQDAPPLFRETVVHDSHHGHESDITCRMADIAKQSCQLAPPTNYITTNQFKIPTNV